MQRASIMAAETASESAMTDPMLDDQTLDSGDGAIVREGSAEFRTRTAPRATTVRQDLSGASGGLHDPLTTLLLRQSPALMM